MVEIVNKGNTRKNLKWFPGHMKKALDDTARRRKIQSEFNKKHGIVPKTIIKKTQNTLQITKKNENKKLSAEELEEFIADLRVQMDMAVKDLNFERAIELRDSIKELTKNRKQSKK